MILSVEVHPSKDTLYVSQVALGDAEPCQIVSGLAQHYSKEQLVGKLVAVASNLKPSKFAGVLSSGMILAAATDTKVQLVEAPEDVAPGCVVTFEGYESTPDEKLNPKVFEKIEMHVDDHGRAAYKGAVFMTPSGACFAQTITNAKIK